jgi:hypothetical protein
MAFVKGQSGNPGGRRKGVVAQIAEMTDDGRKLLEILWEIASGHDADAKTRDRIDAAKYLTDRIFGKAPETILAAALPAETAEAAAALSSEQIRELARIRLSTLAAGAPALPGASLVRVSAEPGSATGQAPDTVQAPDTTSES